MLYTSTQNEKIKNLHKLNNKKYRDETSLFLIEGEHLVLEAYKKGYLKELLLEENTNLDIAVPTSYLARNVMKFISELDNPSNIMGVCNKLIEQEELGNKILVLDNVQDPGNLGTIIRSSVAFNIDTIILSDDTVDLYNSKVLRATQGMFFHTNIIIRNVFEIVALLRNINIPIYGTDVNGGVDARSLTDDDKKRFALIIGNEGNGVKKELNDLCDKKLYIKMRKDVESLNVAIAGSILLYELGM